MVIRPNEPCFEFKLSHRDRVPGKLKAIVKKLREVQQQNTRPGARRVGAKCIAKCASPEIAADWVLAWKDYGVVATLIGLHCIISLTPQQIASMKFPEPQRNGLIAYAR